MSFPTYRQYRDSGVEWVGDVPEHWQVLAGRRVFAQKREPAKEDDEQLSATQKYGVVPQRQFMEAEDQKVVLALSGLGNFKHVNQNDFVISLRSFQGGIEWSRYSGCVSPAYTVLRMTISGTPAYWAYTLKTPSYVAALNSVTAGIRDGKSIGYEQFGQIAVPIPPVSDQAAIAAFLDHETAKIDALVEEQRRLIELLREKRRAVISHAVTKGLNPNAPMKDSSIEWLGEVPEHWVCLQVGKVCKKIADGPHFSPNYVDDGVLFLSARNIKIDGWALEDVKYISETDCKEFDRRVIPQVGDVLYTKGGTTGIAKVVDLDDRFQVWVHIAVLKLEPTIVDPYFLAFALNSIGCYEQSQLLTRGATNNDLGLTRLVKIWFVLPSLTEQKLIVSYLNEEVARLDALIAEAQRGTTILQERRTALISAAVTGKIDVRGLVKQPAELELA